MGSGLIGGFFLQLSYFGTDQSQVGRYLTGQSVTQSRLGLLFNGLAKLPMQFAILFLGVMLFVFYQFTPPPLHFNPVEAKGVLSGAHAGEFQALEQRHVEAFERRRESAQALVEARRLRDATRIQAADQSLGKAHRELQATRAEAQEVLKAHDPARPPNDVNYVFLRFVLAHLPVGLIGLVVAAILSASMNSISAELNALTGTTVVDVVKRLRWRPATPRQEVWLGRLVTVLWGGFAILFAEYASRLGTLIEAVNILGSLFYGTILGIFLVAFYVKRVGGTAVFIAALIAEAGVIACFLGTKISFLWYNVVGCVLVVGLALVLQAVLGRRTPRAAQIGVR